MNDIDINEDGNAGTPSLMELRERIVRIAKECLIGTGIMPDRHVRTDDYSDNQVLIFKSEVSALPVSLPAIQVWSSQLVSGYCLHSGNEALHREVVAACNRARTSISAALRATAAKLEPR